MTIDTEVYKGFEIEISFNKQTKCFRAYSKIGTAGNTFNSTLNNLCMGFKTPTEALEKTKVVMDEFLNTVPKNYKELAEAIQGSLQWTGYGDCHVDEQILEIIIENFLKVKNNVV